MKLFLITTLLLLTQFASAYQTLNLQELAQVVNNNKDSIILVHLNNKDSKEILKVSSLGQRELTEPKCADTSLGVLVCTFEMKDPCGTTISMISVTFSETDAEKMLSTQDHEFPKLFAKFERILVPLIGCSAGSEDARNP